jgi:hypothetical protein
VAVGHPNPPAPFPLTPPLHCKGIDLTPKRRECVPDGDLSMFMLRVI